jgi:hypothetical protein
MTPDAGTLTVTGYAPSVTSGGETYLVGGLPVFGGPTYNTWYATLDSTAPGYSVGTKVDSAVIPAADLVQTGPLVIVGTDAARVYIATTNSGSSGVSTSLELYEITISTGAYSTIAAFLPDDATPPTGTFAAQGPLRGISDAQSYMCGSGVFDSPGTEYYGTTAVQGRVFTAPSGLSIGPTWRYCRSGSDVVIGLTELYRYGNTGGAHVAASAALGGSVLSILILGTDVYAAMANAKTIKRFDLATLTLQETFNRPYTGGGTDVYAVLYNCSEELGLIALPFGSFGEHAAHVWRSGAWIKLGNVADEIVGTNTDTKSFVVLG